MPVSKTGVAAYMNRDLDSWDWMKRHNRRRMFREVREIASGYKFKTRPFVHQLVGFYLGLVLPEFLYFLDMGLGKSKIALDVFGYRRQFEGVRRMLVLAPREINVAGWEEEIELHTNLECIPLVGSTEEKFRLLEESGDVFVCSYPGLLHMLCDRDKGKGKMVPNERRVKVLCDLFGMIVLDEIHKAKTKKSLTFRICNRLTNKVVNRYGLTGTPFGRNPEDLWAQFYLIDKGETLGSSLGMLRDAFFNQGMNEAGFPQWQFDKRKKRRLHTRLKHRSIRYMDSECQDLPPIRSVEVPVVLSPDAQQYYLPAKKALHDARGDHTKVKMNFTKLREICSGFLQWKEEERHVVRLPTNPKLEALQGVLEDLPSDRKVIIAYWFKESGAMITELLKRMKVPHVWIRGAMKKGQVTELSRSFKNNPKVKVMVGNIDLVSHGGNFQMAEVTIYYEEPVSPIDKRQFDKRTRRTGTKARRVYYYYLLTRGTVEDRIHEFLQEGKDLYQAVMEGEAL